MVQQWRGMILAIMCVLALPAQATTLTVAVAANFKTTLDQVAADFTEETGIKVQVSSGATGALYTQILHGAPYDLFLAADDERPTLLVEQGLGLEETLQDYAIGLLAFWVPGQHPDEQTLRDWQGRLAIANPRIAPYGAAAEQVTEHLDILQRLKGNVVRGTNILQTFQYVQSGNVPAGLVALAQLRQAKVPVEQYWLVPPQWHDSLRQQAVVLKRSAHPDEAKALLNYLMAQDELLSAAGYAIPDDH
ncbi:molybdenum ABC transporter, periplasmic molybdate-binding protein [Ferrimonas balearica DSM 9799]|uniref:Molybdenum ABC transporter, periplasmic molybdate-binding protein n=1 Tax=Ferrimonas balearica (strain DSM 9799 / CCM 4581 / KCTC 23876 / PAT) TaxID=550540 RepID=E1SPJ6_FERBD|nr:molybdate ABC transporter substrate-binding protein [Ferrimonas balearica]ADN77813.1 molybdenum ABC transporter, periplasmic molybdate-binding protein [Ferrimonas balearica DSM 9799]MBY6108155.1 molybdate ABC transporter substrate-binding protein [Ferrimonas balearica]